MKCLGKNQKGIPCTFKPTKNDDYCKIHQSYKKMIEITTKENKKLCNNWVRGCWNILYDDYVRCLDCRKYEREKDKELRNKKKEKAISYNNKTIKDINDTLNESTIDTSKELTVDTSKELTINNFMCLVCNCIVDILKNNKCEKCYLNVCNSTKNRNPRDIFLGKLYEYRSGAKKRNIQFNLSDIETIKLFKLNCYYCNEFNIINGNNINGIDRIDSEKNYNIENCVPCCKQCNFMKSKNKQETFFQLCEHIATFNNLYDGKLYNNILSSTKFGRYSEYKMTAKKRNIEFNLSKTQFMKLISKPCIYCGISDITYYKINGAGGVDRVDSTKNYDIENCVSCCGTCNIMKNMYSKEEFLNKCLQITKHNFNNKKNTEKFLIDSFYKFLKERKRSIKRTFMHSKEYYLNRMWYGNFDDLQKIKIKLIIADNEELMDMWNYYKFTVSSLKLTQNSHLVGRQIYLLVADEVTCKYLGVISLTSDYMFLEARDTFIGWQFEDITTKLTYIMNISTCVPLQPFGFNFTGGKLLTKLVFSEQVQNIFREKYNQKLLGITTTSLYGKSIQYDRLKELKFVGYTKGNSVYKFPSEFVKQCKTYLQDFYKTSPNKKLHIISTTLQKLKLPKDEFMSANPKGVYFGFIYPDAKDLLCNKIDNIKDIKLPSIDDIFNDWLNRWAKQRYNNLITNNTFIEYVKITSKNRTKKSLDKLKITLGIDEYKQKYKDYYKINKKKIKKNN